jgi:hypothetical protein
MNQLPSFRPYCEQLILRSWLDVLRLSWFTVNETRFFGVSLRKLTHFLTFTITLVEGWLRLFHVLTLLEMVLWSKVGYGEG